MKIHDAKTVDTLSGKPSFSLKFRIARLLWHLCWYTMASWTPRPFFGWRRCILRWFGARLTKTSRVYGSARIWWPGNLEMGERTAIGPRVNVYCMGRIEIGAGTIISQDAHLCAGTHDYEDPTFQLQAAPISIGRNVWIAAESFVAPGACIKDGVVLAARGAAFGTLEPWTVYRGNPATPLKARRREKFFDGS